jgi:hypothetical protein
MKENMTLLYNEDQLVNAVREIFAEMKNFWDIAPCNLLEAVRSFLEVRTSSIVCETSLRCVPEGCHLHSRSSKSFKSH